MRQLALSQDASGVVTLAMERPEIVYAFYEAITARMDAYSFCLSAGKVGIPPAVIERHLVNGDGRVKARQLSPTGDRHTIIEPLAIGLVQRESREYRAQLEVGPVTAEIRELKAQTIFLAPEIHVVREGLNTFENDHLPSGAIHL